MSVLNPLRLLVLALAIIVFLTGAVWHSVFQRRFMDPMLRFASMGQPLPALLRNPRFARAWNSLVAIVLLFVWWLLGTPAALRILASG